MVVVRRDPIRLNALSCRYALRPLRPVEPVFPYSHPTCLQQRALTALESIITKCWHRDYASANDLIEHVNAEGN